MRVMDVLHAKSKTLRVLALNLQAWDSCKLYKPLAGGIPICSRLKILDIHMARGKLIMPKRMPQTIEVLRLRNIIALSDTVLEGLQALRVLEMPCAMGVGLSQVQHFVTGFLLPFRCTSKSGNDAHGITHKL